MAKTRKSQLLPLNPGVINRSEWRETDPPRAEWESVRKTVLERDGCRCRFCGFRASKGMQAHHCGRGDIHTPENLVTCCVACHAVLHIGKSLMYGAIEIWKSDFTQSEIVHNTRSLVAEGMTLADIKVRLHLEPGELPPDSIEYANALLQLGSKEKRINLPDPYRAVFVKFRSWQLGSAF